MTDKFGNRGIPFVFLGYHPAQKGYRVISLLYKSIIISTDVSYKENVFHYHKNTNLNTFLNPLPITIRSLSKQCHNSQFDDFLQFVLCFSSETSTSHNESNTTQSGDNTDSTPIRRSIRERKQPHWMADYHNNCAHNNQSPNSQETITTVIDQVVEPVMSYFLTSLTSNADPTSFKQVVKCPH